MTPRRKLDAQSPRALAATFNQSDAAVAPDALPDESSPGATELAPAETARAARFAMSPSVTTRVVGAVADGDDDDELADADEDESSVAFLTAAGLRDLVKQGSGTAETLVWRVGTELFACAIAAVEEAVEIEGTMRTMPEMPPAMRGVVDVRGEMLPVYTPALALGLPVDASPLAALVIRCGERRIALAVDDVDDVMTLDVATLRPAPGSGLAADALLLGVARRGGELIGIVDADALVACCLDARRADDTPSLPTTDRMENA